MIVFEEEIGSVGVCLYLYSVGVGGVCPTGIEIFGLLVEAVRS